jgi:hypothetical protein
MRILIIATAIALGIVPAIAQQKQPTTPSPAADANADAKFKTADRNSNGTLEGAELDAFRSAMTQVDTDKDGKLSRTEFLAGVKGGRIR